jgi:multisubunit Na+/H+ antiporter MnhB subunit
VAQSEHSEQDYRTKAAAFQAAIDKARVEQRERGSVGGSIVALLILSVALLAIPFLISEATSWDIAAEWAGSYWHQVVLVFRFAIDVLLGVTIFALVRLSLFVHLHWDEV